MPASTERMVISSEVATRVRMILAAKRIRQQALADALDLAQPAISRRLNGLIAFDIGELVTIAKLLDVPLSELVPESEQHRTAM